MKLVGKALSATRGSRPVFTNIGFEVAGGEAFLLTGPNGAGKTTLLRMIAGFLKPTGGEIRLEDGHAERTLSEDCHYVGHLNGAKSVLTVEENASFWARYLGGKADSVEHGLATFGLAGVRDIPVVHLSAGQQRRLGLSRLLMADRPVWLLDEPTTSLDRAAQGILAGVVDTHLASGGMVVAATHAPLGFARSRELALGAGGVPA